MWQDGAVDIVLLLGAARPTKSHPNSKVLFLKFVLLLSKLEADGLRGGSIERKGGPIGPIKKSGSGALDSSMESEAIPR